MSGISRRNGWTLAIVSVALFMVVLGNLVVSVALPTIHSDLGASIQALVWTVNAYVLASVFTVSGAYISPQAFLDGLVPAIWVGAAVLAAGALVVLALPFKRPATGELSSVSPAASSGTRRELVLARAGA